MNRWSLFATARYWERMTAIRRTPDALTSQSRGFLLFASSRLGFLRDHVHRDHVLEVGHCAYQRVDRRFVDRCNRDYGDTPFPTCNGRDRSYFSLFHLLVMSSNLTEHHNHQRYTDKDKPCAIGESSDAKYETCTGRQRKSACS